MKRLLSILICLSVLFSANATDYTVTNTNDSGDGSLRAALTSIANSYMGNASINFNIPTTDTGYDATTGVWYIRPMTALPYVVMGNNITINGASQTANQGDMNPNGPEIAIVAGVTGIDYGLAFISDNISISSLSLGGFNTAILFFGSQGSSVSDCYIGIMPDGVSAYGVCNNYGITIGGGSYMGYNAGPSRNIAITNNVISGNTIAGIAIDGMSGMSITGNKIGTDRSGTMAVPNDQGIYLSAGSSDNIIGGETSSLRNILSGNTNAAIVMDGSGVRNNVVKGNYIGVDATGLAPLSNHYGIIIMTNANSNIIGGTTEAARNIISANSEIGIYIESADSNHVCGNYIGLDKTGSTTFVDEQDTSLQANGVEINTTGKYNIIGGTTPEERNIISGNKVYGCIYYGNCAYNNICGNYIGTDYSGTVSIPNATGICVDGSSNHNTMEFNLLSGNRSYGLFIVTRGTDSNLFRGNFVGCDYSGYHSLPNDVGLMLAADAKGNIIGGDDPNDRNIFSGNRYAGIEITDYGTEANRIVGNFIGVDITGNGALPNENGVIVSALVHNLEISTNILSSNSQFGLVITDQADSIDVFNNHIGVGLDTAIPLGNGSAGIFIGGGAHHNNIGLPDLGNIIAHNDTAGVMLMDETTVGNRISRNSIYANGLAGIDIYPWGINDNDAGDIDQGCNDLMNYPTITLVGYDPVNDYNVASGHLDSPNPELCTIELYLAYDASSAVREGKQYLASATPNADGDWSVSFSGAEMGQPVLATATNANGSTSEYSPYSSVVLGIDKPDLVPSFSVSPNPTQSYCSITPVNPDSQICVYSLSGRTMSSLASIVRQGDTAVVDLSACPDGIYMIAVSAPNGHTHSFKIEKIH